MNVHDISTESELETLLKTSDVLLIDFWSPVCPPCTML